MIRSSVTLLLIAGAGLVVVTVPVGRLTLLEHGVAILSTEPAKQLGRDLGDTAQLVTSRIVGAFQSVGDAPDRPSQEHARTELAAEP